jgi:hypothetical protein
MDAAHRVRFLSALRNAVERHVRIEILVLDPASKAAEQRADDIGGQFDIEGVIGDVLRSFDGLRRVIDVGQRAFLDVRVYATLPPARLYRWDNRVISSFFPSGNPTGGDVKHYETSVTSRLAQFVDDQFEILWRDGSTRTLDDYFRVDIVFVGEAVAVVAHYVLIAGLLYAESPDLSERIARSPRGSAPSVHLASNAVVDIPNNGQLFDLETANKDDGAWLNIAKAFRRKYGPQDRASDNYTVVYKLTWQTGSEEPSL